MLWANVILNIPRPSKDTFTYKIPQNLEDKITFGSSVTVPFLKGRKTGFVIEIIDKKPNFDCKEIISLNIDMPLFNEEIYELSKWASEFYITSLGSFINSVIPSIKKKKLEEEEIFENKELIDSTVELNDEQKNAKDKIVASITNKENKDFYLKGVTGSGKSEVLLSVAREVINKGKSVIYLVPEILLTGELIKKAKKNFPEETIAVFHSDLSQKSRRENWNKIISGKAKFVLGARSAVFAPVKNLGLIIIDEEHDTSYKSERTPKYHARQIAQKRARFNNATIIYSSATPSLESYKAIEDKRITEIPLTKKFFNSSKASLSVVLNNDSVIFSPILKEKIENKIKNGKQIILFLNKRGFQKDYICPVCGHVEKCPNCSGSLTFHKDINAFKCHYCNSTFNLPSVCPKCGSSSIFGKSYGTEKIEEAAKWEFPFAKVVRLDSDVAQKAKSKDILEDFSNHKYDILVGTQMIAKGHNFKNVELVGVINADCGRSQSDFRSDERLFALLKQVSGRAGRFTGNGEVVIQTSSLDNNVINALKTGDDNSFYKEELKIRSLMDFPPFSRMGLVNLHSINKKAVDSVLEEAVKIARPLCQKSQNNTKIVSYGDDPIEMVKNEHRRRIIISSHSASELNYILRVINDSLSNKTNVHIDCDMDPSSLICMPEGYRLYDSPIWDGSSLVDDNNSIVD